MHVVAGGIELNTFEQEEQTRNVQKIIGHPNYDSHTISNDICLLHLQVNTGTFSKDFFSQWAVN